jgi:hypothetical protein
LSIVATESKALQPFLRAVVHEKVGVEPALEAVEVARRISIPALILLADLAVLVGEREQRLGVIEQPEVGVVSRDGAIADRDLEILEEAGETPVNWPDLKP